MLEDTQQVATAADVKLGTNSNVFKNDLLMKLKELSSELSATLAVDDDAEDEATALPLPKALKQVWESAL